MLSPPGIRQLPAVGEMARCRCEGELYRLLNVRKLEVVFSGFHAFIQPALSALLQRNLMTTHEERWYEYALSVAEGLPHDQTTVSDVIGIREFSGKYF